MTARKKPRTDLRPVSDLRPGSRLWYPYERVEVEILRDVEPGTDQFGRPLLRYWARRVDTGAEGYMDYGEGAEAPIVRGTVGNDVRTGR